MRRLLGRHSLMAVGRPKMLERASRQKPPGAVSVAQAGNLWYSLLNQMAEFPWNKPTPHNWRSFHPEPRRVRTMKTLALLWQIHSGRRSLQIHFRQCGHRCGGSRAKSSRMAWRTAGNVGRGGGPLILFFPPCCFKPAILEESVGDHRHERMTVKP